MINWNGDVAPCCFDKDVDFGMGQAFEKDSFRSIWRGKPYMDFRAKILRDHNATKCAATVQRDTAACFLW